MTTSPSTLPPVTVPLYVFPDGSGGFKIGINISLDNNPLLMYEFDTGAAGFYAAYSDKYFPQNDSGPTFTQTYSSGITYVGRSVSALVGFEGNPFPAVPLNVAQIEQASRTCKNSAKDFTPAQWQQKVNADQPPLWGNFFGDFGSALCAGNGDCSAILPQLPDGLGNGFIVDVGPYPTDKTPPKGQSWVSKGTLQIGLTEADIAQFSAANSTQMNPVGTTESATPYFSQHLVNGTLTVGQTNPFTGPTTFVFDTGAPSTMIHFGPGITHADLTNYLNGSAIQNGTPVCMTFKEHGWTLQFQAGSTPGVNSAETSALNLAKPPNGYVNTGLQPFFLGRVMFDLQNAVIAFAPYNTDL